jgi:hypothetical protein
MNDLLVLALGWLIVLIAFLSFLSLRRYLEHRERMAMIARGITPPEERHRSLSQPMFIRRAGVLQGGLITAMVGLALTLGLYPIGFYVPPSLVGPYHLGPWLLAGLIPLAVGGALILGHYLTPGRPMELPAIRQADRTDGQAPDVLEAGEASQAFPPRVGPIALPEARRWSSYRRTIGQSSESAEGDGEDAPDETLPRANA